MRERSDMWDIQASKDGKVWLKGFLFNLFFFTCGAIFFLIFFLFFLSCFFFFISMIDRKTKVLHMREDIGKGWMDKCIYAGWIF